MEQGHTQMERQAAGGTLATMLALRGLHKGLRMMRGPANS